MAFRYVGNNKRLAQVLHPWRTLVFRWRGIRQMLLALALNFRFLLAGRGFVGTKDGVVALTVSTNYDDILAEVVEHNLAQLDHWVIVTKRDDLATQQLLSGRQNVTVLYWNPHSKGRLFDKGSGLRLAQKEAYARFQNSWYLILDSDVALPQDFRRKLGSPLELDWLAIHGALRVDYFGLADFRKRFGGRRYEKSDPVAGYFQLYCLPFFYRSSRDAGKIDIWFRNRFLRSSVLNGVEVSHLGPPARIGKGGRREGMTSCRRASMP